MNHANNFLRHISFTITNVHTNVFYALSNYNMATVHEGGILRFLFADSLSAHDAANHSSGHAGVELCSELCYGNSDLQQDHTITDSAFLSNELIPHPVIKPIKLLQQASHCKDKCMFLFVCTCQLVQKSQFICTVTMF